LRIVCPAPAVMTGGRAHASYKWLAWQLTLTRAYTHTIQIPHTHGHACTRIRTHTYTYAYTYTHSLSHTHFNTCMQTCAHNLSPNMHIHSFTHAHPFTQTPTNTITQTCMHAPRARRHLTPTVAAGSVDSTLHPANSPCHQALRTGLHATGGSLEYCNKGARTFAGFPRLP